MKRIRGFIGSAGVVLMAIIVSELPPVRRAGQAIEQHRQPLLRATIAVGALGFAMFMGGVLSMLIASGTPMTHQEIEGAISQREGIGNPAVFRASAHRVFGTVAGRQGAYEASFAAVKQAWASGEWRRDALWRRFFIVSAGAVMLAAGIFGSLVVAGPMYVKVLMTGAMVYATAMTVRGFARSADGPRV